MENLTWFKPWIPLQHVPFAVRCAGDGLYAVNESTYLFAVPYNRLFEEDELAPYVTLVMFAPTLGAAERCMHGKLDADTAEPLNVDDLPRLGINDWSYESLNRQPRCIESAQYNKDGKFIHVKLSWKSPDTGDRIEAFFRERKLKSSHQPYAIMFKGPLLPRLM